MPTSTEPSYDSGLKLELVQVLFRHGERMPMKPASVFAPFTQSEPWSSLCSPTLNDSKRTSQEIPSKDALLSPEAPTDNYTPNDLTPKGQKSTLAIGTHLRTRYIDTLSFLPSHLSTPSQLHTRSSILPRTVDSLQNVLSGLYPASTRSAQPVLNARDPPQENLYPNRTHDKRLRAITDGYQDRATQTWAESPELEALNSALRMSGSEETKDYRLTLGSSPRLEHVRDYILTKTEENSFYGRTTASVFTERKTLDVMEKLVIDFRLSGFIENQEVRALGMGTLLGEVTGRMEKMEQGEWQEGEDERFVLLSSHDTTLAAALIVWEADREVVWPWFSTWMAVEMFSLVDEMTGGKRFFVRVLWNDEVVVLPRLAEVQLKGQKGIYEMEEFVKLTKERTALPVVVDAGKQ